jgi:hypothetical protein
MRKKYFSALMAACFLSVLLSAIDCQCVTADCSFIPRAIRAKTPQCHPAAAQTKKEDPFSHKGCCGKCQIEKAAVFSKEPLLTSDVRLKNTLVKITFFSDFHSGIQHPPFSQGEFFESPPGFFERYVLNTTFSFRAPPQGYSL